MELTFQVAMRIDVIRNFNTNDASIMNAKYRYKLKLIINT